MTQLSALRVAKRWLENQQDQDQEKATLLIIGACGLMTHLVFLAVFWKVSLPWMVGANVASIAIWGLSLFTTRQGRYLTSTVLICIEIAGHAMLASYFAGLSAGFQHYLWPAILLVAVVPNGYSRYAFFCIGLLLGALFWVHLFAPATVPSIAKYEIDLHSMNLVLASVPFVISTVVVRYLYQQRFHAMEVMAFRDGLTKLYNRRYTLNQIEQFRQQFPNRPLCIALGDIDYFKRVNDTLGHGEGDKVLTQVAAYFIKRMESRGFCSRWGGEEFLLVLPNHRVHDSNQWMEAVCQNLPDHIAIDDWYNPITCSFGMVQLEKNEDIVHALNRADKLLYNAKEQGRYRVCFDR